MRDPAPGDPRQQEQAYRPRSGLGRPGRAPWIVLALVILAAGAAAVLWSRQRPPAPPAGPPAVTPAAAPPEPAPASAPTVDAVGARPLLESISASRLFRRCLAEGEPVRRWAIATDNLAQGETPRDQLRCLAPARPFSVVRRGSRSIIAPESYRRYDDFADAVASVDPQALARAYRAMHAMLEAAYRELGYPEASLDRVTAKALHRIEAAPVEDGEVAVEAEGGLFLFADRRLENLGSVEKHLLRMGPRNARLLQAKARELDKALGFPPAQATGGVR